MTGDERKTLVLFDLIATLTDAGPRYAAAFARVCAHYGLDAPTEDEVMAVLGNETLAQIMDRFASSLEDGKRDAFMKSCNETCDSMLFDVAWVERLFGDVRETLEKLRAEGYTLGVYTGTRESVLEAQLRYHNIMKFFDPAYLRGKDNQRDAALGSDELKRRHISAMAADFRKIAGAQAPVIVIGDSEADMRAAAALDLPFIGFAPTEAKRAALKKAGVAAIFTDFAKLPETIAGVLAAQPAQLKRAPCI